MKKKSHTTKSTVWTDQGPSIGTEVRRDVKPALGKGVRPRRVCRQTWLSPINVSPFYNKIFVNESLLKGILRLNTWLLNIWMADYWVYARKG